MHKSDLVHRISRLNEPKSKKNYDQTLFPRIDKKKISVYKIQDAYRFTPPPDVSPKVFYVENGYWEDNYTEEQSL